MHSPLSLLTPQCREKRVYLKLIENERARKVTFRKRKQGLTKKMEEITTLCGIEGCIAIFNPQEDEPHIWPSREKAVELIEKYESMPKAEQERKKLDHEKFMTARVEKLREQIAKQEKKNKEKKASLLMYQMSQGRKMEELNIAEVELLMWYSDMKLKEIHRRNRLLPPIRLSTEISPLPPPPPPLPPSVEQPPPPALYLPLGVVQHPQLGNQNEGDNMEVEPSYQVENDSLFMEMFDYGGGPVGKNGMWQGESSNANQHNNMNFQYGPKPGFTGSFPDRFP